MRYSTIAGATIALITACADPTGTNGKRPALRTGSSESLSVDDELLMLNNQIPGFGGYAVGTDGQVTFFLKNLSDSSAAATILREHIANQTYFRAPGVLVSTNQLRVLQGAYDIAELMNWRRALNDALQDIRYLSDLDEANNVLWYGVEKPEDRTDLLGIAASVGIPAGALQVSLFRMPTPSSTLRDAFTNVPGGVQIFNRTPGQCTAAFNVKQGTSTTVDLLTASHCTQFAFDFDGDSIFQPDTSRFIGYEVQDPPPVTNASDSNCPQLKNCRYSDAAIISYSSSSTPDFGYIARPEATGVNLDPNTPYYTIIGKKLGSQLNDVAYKVGRTTGLSGGTVGYSCVHGAYSQGIYMLCQNLALGVSTGGDSGAPVFGVSGTTSATAFGVLWGSSVDSLGHPVFIYSPISSVQSDFPVLRFN